MNSFDDGVPLVNCKKCGEPPVAKYSKDKTVLFTVQCLECGAAISSVSRCECERVWNAANDA